METKINQMRCGECGAYKHNIYIRKNGELLVECTKCKSVNEIVVRKPVIDINHISGDGGLCVY